MSRKPSAWVPLAVGVFGAGFLLASVALPWFGVADAAPGAFSVPAVVEGRDAPATLAFKVLIAVCAAMALRPTRVNPRPRAARIVAMLFAALLMYPHAVMIWCPETAGKANWIDAQHEGLTWSGGDTWISGENKSLGWKDRVAVADMLQEISVKHTPPLSPRPVPFGNAHAPLA